MPGDNTDISVKLISPSPWTRACASHSRGGRTCRRRPSHEDDK